MDAITAGLVGAAIGGVVTGVPTVVTFWLGKRSEEKRHLQQLVMQTALENWKHGCDVQRRLGGILLPLDSYVIHALKLMEIADRGHIDEQTARRHLRELFRIVDAVEDEIEKHNKKDEDDNASK